MTIDPPSLLGKVILIGVTRLDADGNLIEQVQMHGTVTEATEKNIRIRLSTGADYNLPPDYRNIFPAPPGEYRLRSTGEVVVNPDFTTSWTITAPKTH